LLAAGVAQKDVAQQFGVSKFAISRHIRHVAKQAQEVEDNDSPTEIAKWLCRADDQYLLAVANADQRAAVQSLVAGLRAIESKAKAAEREFEANRDRPDDIPEISIEQFDRLAAQAEESVKARDDDHILVDSITWFIGYQLCARPDPLQFDLIRQFLKSCLPLGELCFTNRTGVQLLADYEAFVVKRMAMQAPQIAVHGEN
jgi:hypothetical protein